MKTCRQCNAEMDDEEVVCPQCGFRPQKPAAVGFFKRLFGLGANSATDYLDQGNACFRRRSPDGYISQGDLSGAIAAYTKAIRLDPKLASACQPKLAQVYQYRGDAYLRQSNPDRAIKDYTEAIRLHPALAVAYYYRALAYYQKRRVDEAIADCTEAIRLQPDYLPAYVVRAEGQGFQGLDCYNKPLLKLGRILRGSDTDVAESLPTVSGTASDLRHGASGLGELVSATAPRCPVRACRAATVHADLALFGFG